ncbi:acyl-CoA dehydrogenase family protein [Roseiarcaceae bacterium H3SJ34-1]|uniref:acyl-CoA dehydrogenase family protein n=1 Tax=Terripilifer ovatus TaxID=3032367 RepID=UPI003AB97033|nr:acyl-CoA dehydrogenase family protein [Roseiarcaceae bacterium H3SJ34-1]
MVSFVLPEELRMLKDNLRRYVDAEMIPHERDSVAEDEFRPGWRERFQEGMKKLGLWMMDVPEEHGGGGLDLLAKSVVWTELGRTIALPAREDLITGPSVRSILYSLEGELKEKYLLPVLRGDKRACFAQTEPDAGSDPASMRTTAVRDGNHYVINGTKRFITGAARSDFMQLMAATDRSKGSRGGISCFLVDMDTPGVRLGAQYQTMMGDKPWEIVLDNVRVPATNLVGEEGKGFSLAQKWLGAGRVKHGARAVGVAERSLEMATSYAKQRVTFGRPLADRQGIQWKLADMYMELEVARMLVWRAASLIDQGEEARVEAYHCKYYCDEMAFRAIDTCMQIHGGIALTTDLPIERMWRQQRSYRITEGASEVMRTVIARHVVKAYG